MESGAGETSDLPTIELNPIDATESNVGSAEDGGSENNENEIGEGDELSPDAEELKEELAKIVVHTPTVEKEEEIFDTSEFTESYKDNLPKELLVLQYADNFRRQYVHLYRDRKPLFLNPINECRVEKLVCTTINPTQLPYKELYDWDTAAEFVADYLNFETLDPPYELPKRLLSPTTVLKRQKGNCFEYSTLLCSFLLAAGYDAYVVNGYATKETCLADETREICPLLKKKEKKEEEVKKKELKKYTVKPPRDLRSKFEIKMEQRKVAEKEAEEAKRRQEEIERQLELEKPPPDPLYGLRIHTWILVLPGKREVAESFFIEPFTGLPHPVDSTNYLGIESVWNNMNYWVNMQDCSNGVQGLSYDLGDCTKWEYMFPCTDKPLLQIPETEEDLIGGLDDEEDEDKDVEKHLDMPPSWVQPLKLSLKDFQMRCPFGKKSKLYKRAKLEKFAHYLLPDGLICKLSVYEDRELTDLVQTKEFYAHRQDKLHTKIHNHRTGWTTEYYYPGRQRCLKEHHYKASAPAPENERTMIFYHEARVDGLMKRIETPSELTEHYVNRDDFLFYKHVEFGKRQKKFGPQDGGSSGNARPINKMLQKFKRNPEKEANEDIYELTFTVSEDKIQITYHTEDARIASSTREFIKPSNWEEKGATLKWESDQQHQTFQVDPDSKSKKQVEIYEMLLDLLKAEDICRERVRDSEEEVREILNDRTKEETESELEISVYDTDRNEKAKTHRKELEKLAANLDWRVSLTERLQLEEKMRKQEMEIDYLAPFLAQIGDPEHVQRPQAFKLKEDCLNDLKQRLIDKANLIQARFEKETQELQKKQAWYQQNQVSMSKENEEDYLNYCSDAMFRIHILELRLNRHKEMAPGKYMALELKLRSDPRLSEYFG